MKLQISSLDTRLPSSTCVSIMAALLRFGAARACRVLASYSVRNLSIYPRNSLSLYRKYTLKACQPIGIGSRHLSNETSASAEMPGETLENQTEGEIAAVSADETNESAGLRDRPRFQRGGDFQYERQVRQLGTLVMKPVLVRVFKEILHRGTVN